MKTRKIAVIDYGTGNLRSVVKAFELLEAKVSLVTKPNEIEDVDAVVFPGQGSFDQCMSSLEHSGLRQSLKSWILEDRPFFGICLGLQVLFESSEEQEIYNKHQKLNINFKKHLKDLNHQKSLLKYR